MKTSKRIDEIITKTKHTPRQKIVNKPVDPNIEIFFTAQLKRYGFMKWLEDKGLIKTRNQNFQIFINKTGMPDYISSVQEKNKDVCVLDDIKISHYPKIVNY